MYDLTLIGFPISMLTEERVSSLILEGKDPLEVLKYKFQNIPEEIIQRIINIDPTKKKSYSQWLCKQWDNEKDIILKNLENGRIEKLFQYAKNHPEMQIKDLPSVDEGIKIYLGEEENVDTVLGKSNNPTTYVKNIGADVDSELANDFDVVFKDDKWLIAVPNTYEAACKLGEGMKWCTANSFGNGRSYYNQYLGRGGKYYVNFDLSKPEKGNNGQDYPYTRYQFHFESNQFMDKHDDPVSFEDIDLPQSVYEFYEEQGYNMDDYGLSDEEKMERYDNNRWGDAIRIFDDLYLNQAYDDNYEYEEPTDDTDFYIFDDNDDRDPIDWTEVSHGEDAIAYKDEEASIAVIKKKRDGYMIVYKDPTARGWRDWTVQECETFSIDGNKIVAIVEGRNSHQVFFTDGKHMSTTDVPDREYQKAFINPNFPQDHLCIELINDEGYHTLVEMAPESRLIVSMDMPVNKEYFQMDESGYVLGQYRKYPFLRETEMQSSEDVDFQIESELSNGRFLVSMPSPEEDVDLTYNVLDAHNKKFVCPFNFDDLVNSDGYSYVVDYKSEKFIISLDGQVIGGPYEQVQYVELPNFAYGSGTEESEIINLVNGTKIAKCKNIDLHFGRTKDGVIELNFGNGVEKLFNYKTGEYVLPEYNNCSRVKCYLSDFDFNFILGQKENEEGRTLIELTSQKPLLNNIKHTDEALYKSKMFKVTFMDLSENMFNPQTMQLLLPQNVSKIYTSSEADYLGILPYKIGMDKTFFFNVHTNENMVNPNGVDSSIMHTYFLSNSYDMLIVELNSGITFAFPVKHEDEIKFRTKNIYSYSPISQAQNQPEVLQALSQLTGNDYTAPVRESIRRQFNDIFRRIL